MPNHVRNIIRMEGIAHEPLFSVYEEKQTEFDFNKLIPMPNRINSDWYKWSCARWGTKWNAYETKIIDDNTIAFTTAWSNPEPIVRELANRYPNKAIEHAWADEDKGYNTGYRRFKDGKWEDYPVADESEEALRIYALCWADDEGGVPHLGVTSLIDESMEG